MSDARNLTQCVRQTGIVCDTDKRKFFTQAADGGDSGRRRAVAVAGLFPDRSSPQASGSNDDEGHWQQCITFFRLSLSPTLFVVPITLLFSRRLSPSLERSDRSITSLLVLIKCCDLQRACNEAYSRMKKTVAI